MEVIDYKENEDGSANITFDMEEEYINLFIVQGLKTLMKDEPVVVMDVKEYEKCEDYISKPREVELEPQMAQGLFELGVIEAIKLGIKEHE